MSQQSDHDGDLPAVVNGDRARPVRRRAPKPAAGSSRHVNGKALVPLPPTRSRHKHDYRHRGLETEPAASVTASSTRADHRHRRRPLLVTAAVFVAVIVAAVVFLRALVVQPFSMPGDAMTPTLQTGDRFLVLRSSFLAGSIGRGDVVVLHPPKTLPCSVVGGGSDLVLRVVALPGQVIRSVGGSILVDGRPLRERGWYDARFGEIGSAAIPRTALGKGEYYVLADNRSDACDSRTFGPISRSSVVGEGIAVVGRHGHVSLGTL